MKRVLNSGSVSLQQINGTEQDILSYLSGSPVLDWEMRALIDATDKLKDVKFKFEIKAPMLVFLAFQDAHLGTLIRLERQDHQIAYLPPYFYKQDGSEYSVMDGKSCNDYYTRLNNFFNWSFNFYNKLVSEGLCQEQAKLVLPQGLFINFLWEVNAKYLVEFIEKNYSKSPEIYGYCSIFMLYLEENLPLIAKYLKANRWQHIVL